MTDRPPLRQARAVALWRYLAARELAELDIGRRPRGGQWVPTVEEVARRLGDEVGWRVNTVERALDDLAADEVIRLDSDRADGHIWIELLQHPEE